MNIKKITGKEVKDAVEWLWSNRKNGGCYHKVAWTEPDYVMHTSPCDYDIGPNPHAGREWCYCIGWTDCGNDPGANDPDFYCDEGYRIRAAIRYQDADNGMQTDLDVDFQMPIGNEYGDLYDLSFDVGRDSDFDVVAQHLNEMAEEMLSFVENHMEDMA